MGKNYSHYYEAAATGRPTRWTFPSASGREDWYFVQDSFKVGPQPADLFVLPATCASINCSGTRRQSVGNSRAWGPGAAPPPVHISAGPAAPVNVNGA
jgi:hypothetical protein